MEMLRACATAGSVDDGKSTLIGRLLYDSKSIFEDQLEASSAPRATAATTTRTSRCSPTACAPSASRASRSTSPTATSRRRGASSSSPTRPGHVQYTRNMVTGASTADLAIVLVDARKGVVEQTRRHAFIASLLRHPAPRARVNKMDLVDYDEERFEEIRAEFRASRPSSNIPT
jgi:bifunctional enzyme CysN/CysC